MRTLLFVPAFAVACAAGEEVRTAPERADEPPNVVLIVVDDLGARDLGYLGSEIYDTPRINALAERSVVVENAYSSYPR